MRRDPARWDPGAPLADDRTAPRKQAPPDSENSKRRMAYSILFGRRWPVTYSIALFRRGRQGRSSLPGRMPKARSLLADSTAPQ